MEKIKPKRTPLEKEHEHQDRNAWIFAVVMVIGCVIPIAAAVTLRSPATKSVVVDSARSSAPLVAPAHGSH
jgi:hypothetical protein